MYSVSQEIKKTFGFYLVTPIAIIVAGIYLLQISTALVNHQESEKNLKLSIARNIEELVRENKIIDIIRIHNSFQKANPKSQLCIQINTDHGPRWMEIGNCTYFVDNQLNTTLFSTLLTRQKYRVGTFLPFPFDSFIYLAGVTLVFALIFVILYIKLRRFSQVLLSEIIGLSIPGGYAHKFSEFFNAKNKISELEILKSEALISAKRQELSKQVVHDIRSPISALKVLLTELTLNNRQEILATNIVQRIDSIINDLNKTSIKKERHDLRALIVNIVNEKKYEFTSNKDLDFRYSLTFYPVYIELSIEKLYRLSSNLINNAVEATCKRINVINVVLLYELGRAKILISDTGKGGDENLFNEILAKGISFSKIGGSGLGIRTAREFLDEIGGNLNFLQNDLKGVTAEINIPLGINTIDGGEIRLQKGSSVIVIDDEDFSYEVIKAKLEKIHIPVEKYNHPSLIKNLSLLNNAVIFCDLDFGTSDYTGLDFRSRLIAAHIMHDFFLVTATSIANLAAEVGMNLIPKSSLESIDFSEA